MGRVPGQGFSPWSRAHEATFLQAALSRAIACFAPWRGASREEIARLGGDFGRAERAGVEVEIGVLAGVSEAGLLGGVEILGP